MLLYWLKPYYLRLAAVLAVCSAHALASAQWHAAPDTIRLSLTDMERIFVDSNLSLLAAHYNVDANKALVEQARSWNNPLLLTDQVIAADGKTFPYGKSPDGTYRGQYFIQIQQLITTAGKRSKLIDLATTNATISELQFRDILRSLHNELHVQYYTLIQQLDILHLYNNELVRLSQLLTGMQAQYRAGNVALKDLLRVQALVLSLQQDIAVVNESIDDREADLRVLLQFRDNIFIEPADQTNDAPVRLDISADVCFDSARLNNPGYLLQQAQTVYQRQNLAYQKALRSPDITVGPEFDRNSNFAPNYFGLGVSLPLPLFNKNQGNIHAAAFAEKQQETNAANAEVQLHNYVLNAYNKLGLLIRQNSTLQKDFYDQYDKMFGSMLESYRQKQIGLLEFLDFFDAYKEAQLRLYQQQLDLLLAKEELNYQTGTTIIP